MESTACFSSHKSVRDISSLAATYSGAVCASASSTMARCESLDRGTAGLFKGVRKAKDFGFAERGSDDLQTHGPLAVDAAAGNGDAGQARQRGRNCINISKIHLQ